MSRVPTAEALDPVRRALAATAQAQAAAVLREAHGRRDEKLAAARATADELLATARAEGESEALTALSLQAAQSRREARLTVLTAQRELYEEVRARCRTAASELVAAPDYQRLRRALVETARRRLGPDAVVTDSPAGGIEAVAGHRRIDLSLPVLADRALERSAGEVESLWRS